MNDILKKLEYIDMAKKRKTSHFQGRPTKLPFRVRTIGRINNNPYHSTRGTHNDDVMLTVVISGRGEYHRRGRRVAVSAGMVGMVFPEDDPGLLMADPDRPYDHYFCRFAGDQARQLAEEFLANGNAEPFRHHPAWTFVAEVLGKMCTLPRADEPGRERFRVLDAMLGEALALLTEPLSSYQTGLTQNALLEYLQQHISAPVDLDIMAEHFGISKPHLCRQAKLLLGETIHRTWVKVKMEWACALLGQANLSISEVARRVGYIDPYYFSRVFRSFTTLSPHNWRTKNLQT